MWEKQLIYCSLLSESREGYVSEQAIVCCRYDLNDPEILTEAQTKICSFDLCVSQTKSPEEVLRFIKMS